MMPKIQVSLKSGSRSYPSSKYAFGMSSNYLSSMTRLIFPSKL
jgi:hypothetical protein